jgi:hypothetical protein
MNLPKVGKYQPDYEYESTPKKAITSSTQSRSDALKLYWHDRKHADPRVFFFHFLNDHNVWTWLLAMPVKRMMGLENPQRICFQYVLKLSILQAQRPRKVVLGSMS